MSFLSKIRCSLPAVLLALLIPAQSFAWNFVGHELVARIAWDQLTPPARAQMKLILRQHPALQADLLNGMPIDFGDADLYAFLVSATWPDVIRSETNPWHAKHHHPTWHYINIPYILPGTDPVTLKDAVRAPTDWQPGTEPTNVVQALKKCEHDLRDSTVSDPDKAIALSWYLHLAGDVHQPLHANTLFSARFPAGDKGGNGSFVRAPVLTTQPSLISLADLTAPPGANLIHSAGATAATATMPTPTTLPATLPADAPINLHAYWDNIFGRLAPPRVLDAVQKEITIEYPPAALREQTTNLDYATWADESDAIAIRDVRRDGTLVTGTQADIARNPNHPNLPILPADYLPRAQEVSRLRMATAGYRIANVLNNVFGGK